MANVVDVGVVDVVDVGDVGDVGVAVVVVDDVVVDGGVGVACDHDTVWC